MDPQASDGLRYPIDGANITPAGVFLVLFSVFQRFTASLRFKGKVDESARDNSTTTESSDWN